MLRRVWHAHAHLAIDMLQNSCLFIRIFSQKGIRKMWLFSNYGFLFIKSSWLRFLMWYIDGEERIEHCIERWTKHTWMVDGKKLENSNILTCCKRHHIISNAVFTMLRKATTWLYSAGYISLIDSYILIIPGIDSDSDLFRKNVRVLKLIQQDLEQKKSGWIENLISITIWCIQ